MSFTADKGLKALMRMNRMQEKGGAKSVAEELEKINEELEAAVFDMGKLMEKKEFQAIIDRGWKFAKDWYIVERSPL